MVADQEPGVLVGSGFRKKSDPDIISRFKVPKIKLLSQYFIFQSGKGLNNNFIDFNIEIKSVWSICWSILGKILIRVVFRGLDPGPDPFFCFGSGFSRKSSK